MHHAIAWATVQRIMIDAPSVETDGEDVTEMKITQENADQLLQQINEMNKSR